MTPPSYFARVRLRARSRWDQLEGDPELAGPWLQLFRQVQSPSHVLSELLQNADDAGATEASARIEDGAFTFEHNGEDFTEEQFASLCRFGYSNKRALRTIGFRGIGFKSTFSLGEPVVLCTPTLAVAFASRRFTEPVWKEGISSTAGRTSIRVVIEDSLREKEFTKSLTLWAQNPVSLLFFRTIRKLQVLDVCLHWGSLGVGPVPNSEWMARQGDGDREYLLLRSAAEPFPDDCVTEIAKERDLTVEQARQFPPSSVELVLGAKGRLYVVLPTGVTTDLPFACNAPFIQDPARFGIKSPEVSPTNRWLLRRCGHLAADAIVSWLGAGSSSIEERAGAYRLLPDVDREATSSEGMAAAIVEVAASEVIDKAPVVLTSDGALVEAKAATVVPDPLHQVWPSDEVLLSLTGAAGRTVTRHVRLGDRDKLMRWGLVDRLDRGAVVTALEAGRAKRPSSLEQLRTLWLFVAPEVLAFPYWRPATEVAVLPVMGSDVLWAPSQVVRLGESSLLSNGEDGMFLAEHVSVIDPSWLKLIPSMAEDVEASEEDQHALTALWGKLGLQKATPVAEVIDKVASAMFRGKVTVADTVRLAHIAARLQVATGPHFRYVARNLLLKAPSAIVQASAAQEELIPEPQRDELLLHGDYWNFSQSCSAAEWERWIASVRSGRRHLLPLQETVECVWGHAAIQKAAHLRGFPGDVRSAYVYQAYRILDKAFSTAFLEHWDRKGGTDHAVWWQVLQAISRADWRRVCWATIVQDASNGNTTSVLTEGLPAEWIRVMSSRPCIRDHRGQYRAPGEVLRRTTATEAFLDVESFVCAEFDTEANRPLMDLLGVRSTPSGPERILQSLRALAGVEGVPTQEVEKWYRRLDQLVGSATAEDVGVVREAFREEDLILTADGTWGRTSSVYMHEGDDVPGVQLLRPSMSDLSLWAKVGVAERPSLELALAWLAGLPSGDKLAPDVLSRVSRMQAAHAPTIWKQCGHGVNLLGEWVPVGSLRCKLTRQSFVEWSHLFTPFKGETLDLRRASSSVSESAPLDMVPTLASRLEDRPTSMSVLGASPVSAPWVAALATNLQLVLLEDAEATSRLQALAERLQRTAVRAVPSLEVEPHVDGVPAGEPTPATVVWHGEWLYVSHPSKGRLAKVVPEELSRRIDLDEMRAFVHYSYDRTADDIRDYAAENFRLAESAVGTQEGEAAQVAPEGSERENEVAAEPADAPSRATDEPNEVEWGEGLTSEPAHVEPEDASKGRTVGSARSTASRPSADRGPGLLHEYMKDLGFQRVDESLYRRQDGCRVIRQRGDLFQWAQYGADGVCEQRYRSEEHCLDLAPLQIPAEVWDAIRNAPSHHTLVMRAPSGEPKAFDGERLLALRRDERLRLYTASYRLALSND